jgi:hypothetical protein
MAVCERYLGGKIGIRKSTNETEVELTRMIFKFLTSRTKSH